MAITRPHAGALHGCETLERWIIHGMGHFWPGGSNDPASAAFTDPRAPAGTDIAWRFLPALPPPGGRRHAFRGLPSLRSCEALVLKPRRQPVGSGTSGLIGTSLPLPAATSRPLDTFAGKYDQLKIRG